MTDGERASLADGDLHDAATKINSASMVTKTVTVDRSAAR